MNKKNHVGFGIMMGGLCTALISVCIPPHDTTAMTAMIPVVMIGAILYE